MTTGIENRFTAQGMDADTLRRVSNLEWRLHIQHPFDTHYTGIIDPWARIADGLDLGRIEDVASPPSPISTRERMRREDSILIPGLLLDLASLGYMASGFITGDGERIVKGWEALGLSNGMIIAGLLVNDFKGTIERTAKFWFDD